MSNPNIKILSWNVRGLNSSERCLAVHETVAATPCQIVCLQETKLQNIDLPLATFLGAYKFDRFALKPAAGTKGGIILLWKDAEIDMSNVCIGRYSLSADVTLRHCMTSFFFSTVYGPTRRADKESFLLHMRRLKPPDDTRWLVIGDFNLINKASDKNNRNLNISLMSRFRRAIDHCQLKEISLQNRKFTWSSERRRPHPCTSRPCFL
jgi:exonuclease III